MPWSQSRKTTANRLASIIYGSIATMTADLGIKATDYTGMSLSGGLAAVTAAAIFTKFFLEIVKRETETGHHLPAGESWATFIEALYVAPLPFVGILIFALSPKIAVPLAHWAVSTIAFGTLGVSGFLSSYLLDSSIRIGLTRAVLWFGLGAMLLALKALT